MNKHTRLSTTPVELQSPQASASTNSATRASYSVVDGISQENGAPSRGGDAERSDTQIGVHAETVAQNAGELNRRAGWNHGWSTSRTYRSWSAMKSRCDNPNDVNYGYYGGRGIKVCERWHSSFLCFLQDMGTRPEGMSIDRIDTSGNYEPGNCRWATAREQVHNRRPVKLRKLTPEMLEEIHVALRNGEHHKVIAKRLGVSRSLIGAVKNENSSSYRPRRTP